MSQNTALTEYYKNLLIMQYRDKVKALGHIDNVVRAGMIFDIMIAVRDGYNIETAVGAQQDVLGRILGVSRTITGTTFTRAYYGYALYGDTAPFTFKPMMLYGSVAPDVQFRNYTEGEQSLYDLTDEEYRIIQKLAVVRNMSNASVKSIDDILNVLFGAECYFMDRMNMTIVSYMVGAKWSRIFQIAKSSGLLPNPAGVGTSLVVVPDINNIFAYSLYGGGKPAFAVGYGGYPYLKDFTAIGGVFRQWYGITSDPSGNVWAVDFDGDIYKCPFGSTTFTAIGGVFRLWRGITSDPSGNLWATVYNGDIYKCTVGSTTFTAVGGTPRTWYGITSDPSGNIWAVDFGGDIYKCPFGSTTFTAIGGTSRAWAGITSDSIGTIWATESGGDIYKCIVGSTTFTAIGETHRNWQGITSDSIGTIWATESGGDIYKCIVGSTTFTAIGEISRAWRGINVDPSGNVWAVVYDEDIYESVFTHNTKGCMASYS
jgi:hypothetical protein